MHVPKSQLPSAEGAGFCAIPLYRLGLFHIFMAYVSFGACLVVVSIMRMV